MRLAILIAAGIDVVDLDGDVAAVVRVVRQIDDAGAAAADLVDDDVLADFLGQRRAAVLGLREIVERVLVKGNRALRGVIRFGGVKDTGRGSAQTVIWVEAQRKWSKPRDRGAKSASVQRPRHAASGDAAHRSRSTLSSIALPRAASSAKRGRDGEQQFVVIARRRAPSRAPGSGSTAARSAADSGSRSTSTCAARPLAAASFGRSPDEAVGQVHRGARDAAGRHAELAPAASDSRSAGSTRSRRARIVRRERACAKCEARRPHRRACRSPPADRPRARRRGAARVPRGDVAQNLHAHGQRAARGVAADQRDAVRIGQLAEVRARNPRASRVGAAAASAPASPTPGVAPMAAMSLKFTASARWPMERASRVLGKMPPGDDGVDGRRQVRIRAAASAAPHRRRCPAARRTARAAPLRVRNSGDQLELAEGSVMNLGCHIRAAADSRAARSSTALTNLWPSVAPNCLASCTASASATR